MSAISQAPIISRLQASLSQTWVKYAISLLSGCILALCAPGIGLWWLAWIGVAPALLWLSKETSAKQAFFTGCYFGAGFHAVYLYWLLSLHPMTWLGLDNIASQLISSSAWLILIISGGFGMGLLFALLQTYFKQSQSFKYSRLLHWLLVPTLWVAWFELYKINAFWIPWALLGYTQAQFPLMRLLAENVGDTNGVTWVIMAFNTLIVTYLTTQNWKERFGLLCIFGSTLYTVAHWSVQPDINPFPISTYIYQGNVDIGAIKTGEDLENVSQKAYLTPISKLPLAPGSLLALPEEGIVPGWVNQDKPLENKAMQQLQSVANERQAAILTGISLYKDQTPKASAYNATALLQPNQAPQFYAKTHLVPFGEEVPYLPAAFVNQWLEQWQIPYQFSFEPGGPPKVLTYQASKIEKPVRIGSFICFEMLYSDLTKTYKKQGAQLLVNSSNLGWFHQNALMTEQFLAIAQMRAAESGLPLVLSANSSPSALISPTGQIIQDYRHAAPASISWRIPSIRR